MKSFWAFDRARFLFIYEEIIAKLIHDLKYSGKTTGISTFRWLSEQSVVLNDLAFRTLSFLYLCILNVRQNGLIRFTVVPLSLLYLGTNPKQ